MTKKETVLMRIARMNDKLANDTYKKIIRQSPLVSSNMTIKNFKEAYHSPKTIPEYRAMLLSSLYDKKNDFRLAFRHLTSNKRFLSSNVMRLTISKIDGKTSFVLSTINEDKLRGEPIAFNQQMREEVRRWQPPADKNKLLTKALLSGKVHTQKAAFFLSDVKTAIYAAADMLITNVNANDPLLEYLIDSDKPTRDELIQALTTELGHFNTTQQRFLNDLEHMTKEMKKLTPILEKMGIDTTDLEVELAFLKSDVNTFVNTIYQTKEEEIDGLYESFTNIKGVIDETLSLAEKIDSIDLEDKALYSIGRLEVLPTFVDYNLQKLGKHRRAADGAVYDLIKKSLAGLKF